MGFVNHLTIAIGFVIVCATARPLAALAAPPPPTNLHQAADATECVAHGGGKTCAHLGAPNVVFVWDGDPAADAFELYRIDGGKFSVGIVQRNGGTIRTSLVDASVPPHACYAVSAIRGGSESATGEPWCAPGPVTIGQHARTSVDDKPPAGRIIGAAQPRLVHRATDVAECQRHAGNFFCAALKGDAANLLVIVWDAGPAAAAYHVYRTDGGRRTLVATQDQRFAGVLPSAFGLESVETGSCFSVTETRDGVESVPSDPFCVGTDLPGKAKTVVLAPTHERTSRIYRGHTPNLGAGGSDSSGYDIWPGLVVGYEHATNDMGLPGDDWSKNIYRTGLFFDLGFLAGLHQLRRHDRRGRRPVVDDEHAAGSRRAERRGQWNRDAPALRYQRYRSRMGRAYREFRRRPRRCERRSRGFYRDGMSDAIRRSRHAGSHAYHWLPLVDSRLPTRDSRLPTHELFGE